MVVRKGPTAGETAHAPGQHPVGYQALLRGKGQRAFFHPCRPSDCIVHP